jgi:hypothetical protein
MPDLDRSRRRAVDQSVRDAQDLVRELRGRNPGSGSRVVASPASREADWRRWHSADCVALRDEVKARLGRWPGTIDDLTPAEHTRYRALDPGSRAVDFFQPAVEEARQESERRHAAERAAQLQTERALAAYRSGFLSELGEGQTLFVGTTGIFATGDPPATATGKSGKSDRVARARDLIRRHAQTVADAGRAR